MKILETSYSFVLLPRLVTGAFFLFIAYCDYTLAADTRSAFDSFRRDIINVGGSVKSQVNILAKHIVLL
jgi:hypothetical protein